MTLWTWTILLSAILVTSQALTPLAKSQRSGLGCRTAYYLLTNSIPRTCNAALNHISASLANTTQEIESSDICTSYCINPLKQAALECSEIEALYTAISMRCCRNAQKQQCFSLTGHPSLAELVSECDSHLNQSRSDNCSSACSAAVARAVSDLGCCVSALLTGSSHQQLLDSVFWQQCLAGQEVATCTHCSKATVPRTSLALLLTTATLLGSVTL